MAPVAVGDDVVDMRLGSQRQGRVERQGGQSVVHTRLVHIRQDLGGFRSQSGRRGAILGEYGCGGEGQGEKEQ